MRSKIRNQLITVVALAIAGFVCFLGYQAGYAAARQECIDAVTENCEYICGVGAEFYYPDEENREFNNIEDSEQDSMIARKRITRATGSHLKY